MAPVSQPLRTMEVHAGVLRGTLHLRKCNSLVQLSNTAWVKAARFVSLGDSRWRTPAAGKTRCASSRCGCPAAGCCTVAPGHLLTRFASCHCFYFGEPCFSSRSTGLPRQLHAEVCCWQWH